MVRLARAALWILLAVFLTGLAASHAEAQFPQTCSTNECSIDMSSSTYVLNNHWNLGNSTGSQSIRVTGPTAWSTSWDWNRAEEWSVTTYSSTVTGWHWGWHFPAAQTGLPVQVSSRTPINTTVAYDYLPDPSCGASRTCRIDVAYDVWFHTTSNPGTANPVYEMMIWTAYSRDLFVGYTPAGYATLGGHQWKIIAQSGYAAFVLNEPADLTGASLNLTDFTDWLVANLGMPSSWWLDSVEFGPEVYKGKGTLNVTSYTISVGGSSGSPTGPAPSPSPSFTIGTTTVSPAQLAPGQGAAITTQVTSATATSNIIVDMEIYDSSNRRIAQYYLTGQNFAAGETRPFTWQWPGTLDEGTYMVQIGLFRGDWGVNYVWDGDAAPISVEGAPAAFVITSTTASPDPVRRNRTLTATTYVQAKSAANGVRVDIEIYNDTGDRIGQKICTLDFAAGQTRRCTYKYRVPGNLPLGNYSIAVGAFKSDWSQLYTWSSNADTFTVK